jgi:hypothetical protein
VPQEPDFGSKGLGPAYRSLMTFGQADDLVYEFASYSIDAPGRSPQHWPEVCVSTLLMRSLRVGQHPATASVPPLGHITPISSMCGQPWP